MCAARLPPPGSFICRAQQQSQHLLDQIDEVLAVITASVEGSEVTSAVRSGVNPERISEVLGSLVSMLNLVMHETNLGRSKSLAIETDLGFTLIRNLYYDDVELIFIVIVKKGSSLGEALSKSNQIADHLLDV